MMDVGKASSCAATGELDGWVVAAAYTGELAEDGGTRLCVTAPPGSLQAVHAGLIAALQPPLSVLYRQKVDRRDPKPQGHPGRDFVGLELDPRRVLDAFEAASSLLYRDARCEVWVRGGLQEQVVLDTDGAIYVYPDDPSFRDALDAAGLSESDEVVTLERRDYVRHWFLASADAQEDGLIAALKLTEVPVRR